MELDSMRVLVTGGTGLVGRAAVEALRDRGHEVRVLARHTPGSRLDAIEGVEYREGDLADPASLRGACDDCEVVVHAAAVVHAPGGDAALETINVGGTRHLLAETLRAGVRRLVHVSSLGAERGDTAYHRTKRESEVLVRQGAHEWVVLRPGNVYGPGESHIARFMHAMRTWPVVPVPGDPDQRFQPIWVEDLAACIALAAEQPALTGRTYELVGPESVSTRELHEWVGAIVGRRPPLVRVPVVLIGVGAPMLEALGIPVPITRDEARMVAEGNLPADPNDDTIARVFGLAPMRLAEGLRRLARATPEQLPGTGFGEVRERRFRVHIRGSAHDAASLLAAVSKRFVQLMPSVTADAGTEPASNTVLRPGAMVSIAMPMRGHTQVRVEATTDTSITCATLAGHVLAGMVRFRTEDRGDGVVFEVHTVDHAGSRLDRVALALGGLQIKQWTWRRFVKDVVTLSGGHAPDGIEKESAPLTHVETQAIRRRLEEYARAHERARRDQATPASLPGT
jgi:NADH dehydrogenase